MVEKKKNEQNKKEGGRDKKKEGRDEKKWEGTITAGRADDVGRIGKNKSGEDIKKKEKNI